MRIVEIGGTGLIGSMVVHSLPFVSTTLIHGPVAQAWHGADIAYFVNLLVAAVVYGGYRLLRRRRSVTPATTNH